MAKLFQTLFRTRSSQRSSEISRYDLSAYIQQLINNPLGVYGGNYSSTRDGKPVEENQGQFSALVQQGYKANGPIFAIILARLMLFSEARFQFRRLINGRPQDLFGTKALSLLERPWPNGTTGELLARMEQDVSLSGNFYCVNEGDRLRRLRPDWVSIVLTGDPAEDPFVDVAGYVYRPGGYGEPVPYLPNDVAHWCADEETEILTADGWKDFRALRAGDEVLTLNHETGMSEWQPVEEVCIFPAQPRSLVSMEGREFSSLTTGNHRWPVERKNGRARTYVRRWATSDSLSTGDRIPIAAHCADTPVGPKWADALVELVAWFWTEGRFKSGRRPGLQGRGIQIAQSMKNASNVARIRAALSALFGPAVDSITRRGPRANQPQCWREHVEHRPEGDLVMFSLSASASDVITDHAPKKVVATSFLRALTQAQLELYIKVALLADNNGADRLAQKSPAMAEQFALACILAGYPVSIRPGATKLRGYQMTNVRMLKKRHIYPQESARPGAAFKVSRVEYNGHVWCPRTGNQTWLARRHGSVYFTGNSPVPDPEAQYRGMSWVTPVVRELQADDAATRHKDAFFRNGAKPGLVVSLKESIKEEQFRKFVRAMNENHQGADQAYKTLYLAGGADVTVAGANLQQLDFKGVIGSGETRLCAAGGVPPIIVGLSEGLASATYSNYSMARRKFGDHWARPQWRSACAALSNLIDVPGGAELWYDDTDIAFLREDQKDAAEIQSTQAGTINTLITAGFTPESAIKAVTNSDMTMLVHTGLVSVQLQPPGGGIPETDPALAGETPAPAGEYATDEQGYIDAEEAQYALPAAETARSKGRRMPVDHDGSELHDYWTRDPEGLAKWADTATPYENLYEHLLEHMHGDSDKAHRTAAAWFHDVFHYWPGSDKNRVAHGKPPRGDKVGPG